MKFWVRVSCARRLEHSLLHPKPSTKHEDPGKIFWSGKDMPVVGGWSKNECFFFERLALKTIQSMKVMNYFGIPIQIPGPNSPEITVLEFCKVASKCGFVDAWSQRGPASTVWAVDARLLIDALKYFESCCGGQDKLPFDWCRRSETLPLSIVALQCLLHFLPTKRRGPSTGALSWGMLSTW